MASSKKGGSSWEEERSISLPRRRSARQQRQQQQQVTIRRRGSITNPIIIPDSPHSVLDHETQIVSSCEPASPIEILPSTIPSQLPGLSEGESKLLQYKQERLAEHHARLIDTCANAKRSKSTLGFRDAVQSTLVFAQEEAGTAVCVSEKGLLLTCSHCVAESEEDLDPDKVWWLLFASGRVVRAKTKRWDGKRDLALLEITAAQPLPSVSVGLRSTSALSLPQSDDTSAFPYAALSATSPTPGLSLVCIGHPGSEDLEIGRPGVATGYDVLHTSDGHFRGYAEGQDVHDNSEIGALMHDCWTYWGHSGAPLVGRMEGMLVGLHSSWDEDTGMRRGVAWEAIKAFLEDPRSFEKLGREAE